MGKFRFRESRSHKKRTFGRTADKVNVQNVKMRQPRGGRCL